MSKGSKAISTKRQKGEKEKRKSNGGGEAIRGDTEPLAPKSLESHPKRMKSVLV